jgi:radical SAM superfamily enzyme YgiQ (UPF0313 family)
MQRKPLALLIFPPVYDFALYDLFIKPYSLLRLGKWLESFGYRTELVNYLDYREPETALSLGKPRRKPDGTGKFFRQRIECPEILKGVGRRFARYGILRGSGLRKLGHLKQDPPSLVLVSTVMTYWYLGVREVVQDIRRLFPKVPVVVGGIYATLCADHCRKVIGPDHLVRGGAYPQLAEILGGLSLPVPSRPPDERLLLLPDVFTDAATLYLNRGCPFRCDYCASFVVCGDFVCGDPAFLFGMIREIHTSFGTRNFAFYDDALLTDGENGLFPLLQSVIEADLSLNFYMPNAVHLAQIDSRCARLLKQAGFREVRIGFESASRDFHCEMGRKLQVGMLADAVEELKIAGFTPHEIRVYLLAGLPGQLAEEVEASIRYAASFGIHIQLAEYSPVPFTRLWTKSVEMSPFPLEEEPLTHNNSILPLGWAGFNRSDLQSLKDLARSLSPRL